MFGKLLNKVTDTVSDFVDDPIGTVVDITTQPIRDGIAVIDGLTEGELREKAALRLGADVAGGMALSELVEWYSDL